MADEIRIDGVKRFIDDLDTLVAAIERATVLGLTDGASLIERYAKQGFAGQHALGTPRPNPDDPRPYAVTEDLKRSIGRHPATPERIGRGVWRQSVAPTMIYGRRIELGFQGQDSLGRNYNQRAYPYLRPAVKRATPQLQPLFAAAWRRAIESVA